MDIENVRERFLSLAGLSSETSVVWDELIQDAFENIHRRVREDLDTQENCRCLEAAAAALAFYNYKSVVAARGNLSSFKAGEVSIQTDTGVKEAYAFFLRALEPCSKLFSDDDFLFGRMETVCTET